MPGFPVGAYMLASQRLVDSGQVTGDSEVTQFASPLVCVLARTIALEESVTGD